MVIVQHHPPRRERYSCVDYGHTFSKIIEMVPGADIMHGEAVNVDGFLCLVLAKRRGMISKVVLDRVFDVMKSIGLPTIHESVELAPMVKVGWRGCVNVLCVQESLLTNRKFE